MPTTSEARDRVYDEADQASLNNQVAHAGSDKNIVVGELQGILAASRGNNAARA